GHRAVAADEIARRLRNELNECRMNREIVPLPIDRRRQHEHAPRIERTLDQERRTIGVRHEDALLIWDIDGPLSEESDAVPLRRIAQNGMTRVDRTDAHESRSRLADPPVRKQRMLCLLCSGTERREERTACTHVLL